MKLFEMYIVNNLSVFNNDYALIVLSYDSGSICKAPFSDVMLK